MALVPVPPTSASFLASSAKPEAFTGNPSASPPVPGIPLATIDQALRQESDAAQAEAFGDRATLPILQWDEGMEGHVFARAARRLMSHRNFNPKAGADAELVENAKRADTFIEACGPGAPGGSGKRITPMFVDSKQNQPTDGVTITSHRDSDWYARGHGDPGRTRSWGPG